MLIACAFSSLFKEAKNKIPFTSYDEVYATIKYDSDLKALFYGKMMFIETAVKNIALESILINSNSERISDICNKVISSYKNAPAQFTSEQRRRLQQNKLNLQNSIQASLANAYRKGNPKITRKEISTILGKSISTISRVLKDNSPIKYVGFSKNGH